LGGNRPHKVSNISKQVVGFAVFINQRIKYN